jgi:hypothetical protein
MNCYKTLEPAQFIIRAMDSTLLKFLFDQGVSIAAFVILLGYFIQTQKQLVQNMLNQIQRSWSIYESDREAILQTLNNNTAAWLETMKALEELKEAVHALTHNEQSTQKPTARRNRSN